MVKLSDGTTDVRPCIKWSKRPDMCPTCAPPEIEYLAGLKRAKAERDAKRAAESKQRVAAQLERDRIAAQGAAL